MNDIDGLKIEDLRILCNDETIVMTNHLTDRCRERGIKYEDVKYAIRNGEIIENYPDAYPSPACLVLAVIIENKPLHVVAGIYDGKLWIITAYYPTLDKWESDYKTRKAVK